MDGPLPSDFSRSSVVTCPETTTGRRKSDVTHTTQHERMRGGGRSLVGPVKFEVVPHLPLEADRATVKFDFAHPSLRDGLRTRKRGYTLLQDDRSDAKLPNARTASRAGFWTARRRQRALSWSAHQAASIPVRVVLGVVWRPHTHGQTLTARPITSHFQADPDTAARTAHAQEF